VPEEKPEETPDEKPPVVEEDGDVDEPLPSFSAPRRVEDLTVKLNAEKAKSRVLRDDHKAEIARLKARHASEQADLKAKQKEPKADKDSSWDKYDVGSIHTVEGVLRRVELKFEMIDEVAVMNFLGHVAARRDLRTKDGYLVSTTLCTLLQQSREGILPVVTSETTLYGFRRRTYSGVARLGSDLGEDVKATFNYQRKLGIPRSRMGHSVFSSGKLIRYVTAGNLNMIEIDLNVAFIQLRVDKAAPSCAMPCCRLLLAQESTNDFLAVLAGEGGLCLMKKELWQRRPHALRHRRQAVPQGRAPRDVGSHRGQLGRT